MADLSPEAERIAQVIAAWNMVQNPAFTCWSDTGEGERWHPLGRLCVHQIRELAELVQAELAKKEEA
mgnify:FL=1